MRNWSQFCTRYARAVSGTEHVNVTTSFERCKQLMSDLRILTLYNLRNGIQLTCDASAYGLDTVLSHVVGGVHRIYVDVHDNSRA